MDTNHFRTLSQALKQLQNNRWQEAEQLCEQVLAADDNNTDAHFLSAMAAHYQGQNETALQRFDQAIALNSGLSDVHANRAMALAALNRMTEAEQGFRHALCLNPEDVSALVNLGRLLVLQKRHGEALTFLAKALLHTPDDPVLLGDLAVVLTARQQLSEGLDFYQRSLAINPRDPDVHHNYSRALLMAGDYEAGWRENEWRWHSRHYRSVSKRFPAPRWDGSPLEGRRILLVSEQGLGDAILMVRYAPLVKKRGGEVLVQCRPELAKLFATAAGVDRVCPLETPQPPVDLCFPMFSLPLLFKTRVDSVPIAIPYLSAPKPLLAPLLPEGDSRKRVGLIWAGKSQQTLKLPDLQPLFTLAGVALFSLQAGGNPREVAATPLIDLNGVMHDFAATAALMAEMDLIISVDTSSAHLAGALGKPLWVLVHYTGDWRWQPVGGVVPWYPAARIFRQSKPDDWSQTLTAVAEALRQHAVPGSQESGK